MDSHKTQPDFAELLKLVQSLGLDDSGGNFGYADDSATPEYNNETPGDGFGVVIQYENGAFTVIDSLGEIFENLTHDQASAVVKQAVKTGGGFIKRKKS